VTDMAPGSEEPNQRLDYDLASACMSGRRAGRRSWRTGTTSPARLCDATQLLREMAKQQHVPTDPVSAPETEEFTRGSRPGANW
jgi:hypothetical protein